MSTSHHANGSASERSPLLADSRSNSKPTSSNGSLESSQESSNDQDTVVEDGIGAGRKIAITVGLGILVFLQATNMSMLTTIQSSIADDLDAYEEASWFTSAFLVGMSSFAPVMGRLSTVFSPRRTIFFSTVLFALGALLTSLANHFAYFIVGRAIAGVGGSGVFTVAIILVIQLSSPKQRGLVVGMLNSGYTVGVSVGAIAAGALLPVVGWVRRPSTDT